MAIGLHVGQFRSGVSVTQAGWCDIRRRSVLPRQFAGFEKAWEEGQGTSSLRDRTRKPSLLAGSWRYGPENIPVFQRSRG